MSFSETISPFFGRCAFVWFYLTGAVDIAGNWRGLAQDLATKNVPIPPLVLLIALILIVMGSISLLFGYHTRHGAMLLFGMTMLSAVIMHDYWHYADAAAHARDHPLVLVVAIAVRIGPDKFAAHLGEEPGAERHSLTLEKPCAACTRASCDTQRDSIEHGG